jgi:hypothetical protein
VQPLLRLRFAEDAALPRYQNISKNLIAYLNLLSDLKSNFAQFFSLSHTPFSFRLATLGGNTSFSFVLLFFISLAWHQAVAADELLLLPKELVISFGANHRSLAERSGEERRGSDALTFEPPFSLHALSFLLCRKGTNAFSLLSMRASSMT